VEDELFFPSPPYRDFDGALTSMAVEFAARAEELDASETDFSGEVLVLGKCINQEHRFEWLVQDDGILFRGNGEEYVSGGELCEGRVDLTLTRSVFLDAVHASLRRTLLRMKRERRLQVIVKASDQRCVEKVLQWLNDSDDIDLLIESIEEGADALVIAADVMGLVTETYCDVCDAYCDCSIPSKELVCFRWVAFAYALIEVCRDDTCAA
jgi:hypothetical protein